MRSALLRDGLLVRFVTERVEEMDHYIEFGVNLNNELGIKSLIINQNTTELPNNSELIKLVAIGLLKAVKLNEDSLAVQDLMSELGIKTPSS